ncbi:type III secretion system translocon subunit SctB [Bordetella genomosp. 13]|uniref:type III secretion system translocon subunit SctB n=1 Tax=Bordetella genomosp. 13 TaxID=463040 RepID=UPI00119C976A|nr:type III secretion system translocon subunit SctB [Bordetella genomosp. 13]
MNITFNPNAGGVAGLGPTTDVDQPQSTAKAGAAYLMLDASMQRGGDTRDALGARGVKSPTSDYQAGGSDASQALSKLDVEALGTDIYAVMALFQKCAQEQRDAARQVRDADLSAQVATLKSAAQEIRNAAQDRMVGAIVQGAFQIAAGAMQMGAGIASGIQGAKAAGLQQQAAKSSEAAAATTKEAAAAGLTRAERRDLMADAGVSSANAKTLEGQASTHTNRSQVLNSTGAASGQVLGGIGTIVNATQERKAAEHDAKRAELEAQAKVQEDSSQKANELMQQMMDVIRDVRDKLSSIDQSRMETNRGIARNI